MGLRPEMSFLAPSLNLLAHEARPVEVTGRRTFLDWKNNNDKF